MKRAARRTLFDARIRVIAWDSQSLLLLVGAGDRRFQLQRFFKLP